MRRFGGSPSPTYLDAPRKCPEWAFYGIRGQIDLKLYDAAFRITPDLVMVPLKGLEPPTPSLRILISASTQAHDLTSL